MSRPDPRDLDCPRGIDAGAYVLAALDPGEDAAFAEHLHDCAHCRAEVAHLQPVADTLPLAAPQATPPAALKSRIMAVVNAEAELLQAAGAQADRVAPAAPRRRRLPRMGFSLRPAFAGALACGLLAVGIGTGVLVEDNAKPDTTVREAQVHGPAAGAHARLTQTGSKASLELTKMPTLRDGQVYQVWFNRGDGQFRPTHTLFVVRPDGRARVAIDEPVKGVKQIAVTVEKSGGALAPSGPPMVTASPA